LEAAIEMLKQFSSPHRNIHREIKEGLPLVMKHLRTCSLATVGGPKATLTAAGAGKTKTVKTKEASTNTVVLREKSPPKRAPTHPSEKPGKPSNSGNKSSKKK